MDGGSRTLMSEMQGAEQRYWQLISQLMEKPEIRKALATHVDIHLDILQTFERRPAEKIQPLHIDGMSEPDPTIPSRAGFFTLKAQR